MPPRQRSPRERIVERSRGVVRGYAAAREHWNLVREIEREVGVIGTVACVVALVEDSGDSKPPAKTNAP